MSAKFNILLLNGPNLNMLGKREPGIYGSTTLNELVSELTTLATSLDVNLTHTQSNAESDIIDAIHNSHHNIDFIVINPAAFTHTSVAIRDALLAVNIPFVEVHLSNVHSRETFRHHSYFSDIAVGVICGLGTCGYEYALNYATKWLTKT